jgi:hypothetical protein
MAMFGFQGQKGLISCLGWEDTAHHDLGLGGGIVKISDECGPHNQSLGSGFTVYHFVESLEKVGRSP